MPVFHGFIDENDELMVALEGDNVSLGQFLERLEIGVSKRHEDSDDLQPDDPQPTVERAKTRPVTSLPLPAL